MTKQKTSSGSIAETMIRQALQQSALGKALGVSAEEAFEVQAPKTEGLVFPETQAGELAVEEVLERFEALRRNVAPKQALEAGEFIEFGDRICIDVIPYVQGKVVPLLAQRRAYHVVGEDALVAGLDSALVGLPVKFRGFIKVTLPDDFAHPEFAGRKATFGIEIHEGVRTLIPEDSEDGNPQGFDQLGRGNDLDEVMRSIADELRQEKEWYAYLASFRDCMLQLGSRVTEPISEAKVDQELTRFWMENEGKTLLELNVPNDDRDVALKTFIATPSLRAEFRSQIAVTAALDAVAKRDNVRVDEISIEDQWNRWGMANYADLSLDDVLQKARSGDPTSQRIISYLAYLQVADHVISSADIQSS